MLSVDCSAGCREKLRFHAFRLETDHEELLLLWADRRRLCHTKRFCICVEAQQSHTVIRSLTQLKHSVCPNGTSPYHDRAETKPHLSRFARWFALTSNRAGPALLVTRKPAVKRAILAEYRSPVREHTRANGRQRIG
jgi:hypothetical protein